jgi:hypothetical protein
MDIYKVKTNDEFIKAQKEAKEGDTIIWIEVETHQKKYGRQT